MTQAVAHILEEVERLSPPERADLADRIVGNLGQHIPADLADAQTGEVRRRIAEVEGGKVTLITGEEALARVRALVRRPPLRTRTNHYGFLPY